MIHPIYLKLSVEEKNYLQALATKQPDIFKMERPYNEDEVMANIGITALDPNRPEGYLKLYPQDFVVEEVRTNNHSSQVEIENEAPRNQPRNAKFTLYADLIKVGISTIEAVDQLATKLDIRPNKIGYAGIKDTNALTSQSIALPKISFDRIKDIQLKNMFLANLAYGGGFISKGSLAGNKFTIFIRTEKQIVIEELTAKLGQIKKEGFLNYYHNQRFGSPRFISHYLGKMILQRDYAGVIKLFLTEVGPYSINLTKNIRQATLAHYGDWTEMKRQFEPLASIFRIEMDVLNYLEENPKDFIGALVAIKDQTRIWVYAYSSWLFNKYISKLIAQGRDIPENLPLLLSDDSDDIELYQEWLEIDNIQDIELAISPFDFLELRKRPTPTKIFPQNIMIIPTNEGVICHFYLGKGAYATTFLSGLFKLNDGLPYPTWLKKTPGDVKKFLNIGSIAPAINRLKEYIIKPEK